jgi:propanol-preferring alcohol dehydrogenase
MKAMVLYEHARVETHPLALVDVSDPRPGPGEVRLRVTICAICRTDLHVIEQDLPTARLPVIPGHQIVGVVDEVGPGCRQAVAGQRVGVAWLRSTCGACQYCASGRENLCPHARFTGYHDDGGFAEYAVVREDFAYPLPEAITDEQVAPLLCAGLIGYRALERAQAPAGGTICLYGFGSSAHLVLQFAQARGHEVWVVTRGERHRALAHALGAGWVGASAAELPEAVDSAIIFAPAGELVPAALEKLKPGGTLALAGITMTQIPALNYERHLFQERNLRSVTANTREDGRRMLEEAQRAGIKPRVTLFELAQANEALALLKADALGGTGLLQVAP